MNFWLMMGGGGEWSLVILQHRSSPVQTELVRRATSGISSQAAEHFRTLATWTKQTTTNAPHACYIVIHLSARHGLAGQGLRL